MSIRMTGGLGAWDQPRRIVVAHGWPQAFDGIMPLEAGTWQPLVEVAVGEEGDQRYTEALRRAKVGDRLVLKRYSVNGEGRSYVDDATGEAACYYEHVEVVGLGPVSERVIPASMINKIGPLDAGELAQVNSWAGQAWEAGQLLDAVRLQRLADAYRSLLQQTADGRRGP